MQIRRTSPQSSGEHLSDTDVESCRVCVIILMGVEKLE